MRSFTHLDAMSETLKKLMNDSAGDRIEAERYLP
jgi:hypothetical protein